MASRFSGPLKAEKAYSNKTHSQTSMVPDFDRTINSKAAASGRAQLVLPDVKQGRCYFQPFNALDMSDPGRKVLPGRNSEQERDQSDWTVSVAAANYVGTDKKVTFLLYHPDDAEDAKPDNPYQIFSRACYAANTSAEFANGKAWDAKWNILVTGKKGAGPAIPKPSTLWYMQGAVFQNGTKVHAKKDRGYKPLGLRAGDPLPVLRTSGMCGQSLVSLLDTKKGDDYLYDAVGTQGKNGVTGGRILQFYRPTEDMEALKYPNTWDGNWPKGGIISAQVYLRKMIKLGGHEHVAAFSKEDLEIILKSWTPWFNTVDKKTKIPGLLHIPSAEEQVEMIVRAFASIPKLVQLAFYDHTEWLELDAVQSVLKARASSVSPKDDDDEDEGEDDEIPAKKKRLAPTTDDDDEDDDDTEDDVVDDEDEEEEDEDSEDEDDADDEDGDEDSEDEDDEDEDEKPAKKGKGKKSKSDDEDEDEEDSEDDDSEDEDSEDDDAEDDDSEDEDSEDDEDEKPAKKAKGKKSKDEDEEEEDEEDDSDEDSDEEDSEDEDDSDEDSEDEDEDEDEKPKAKKATVSTGKKKPADDDDEEEEEEEDEDDEEEDEAPVAKKGKKAKPADDDEDEFGLNEDDEAKIAPAKGKADKSSKKGKNSAEVGKVASPKEVKKAIADATTRAGSRPNKAAKPPTSKGGKAKRK